MYDRYDLSALYKWSRTSAYTIWSASAPTREELEALIPALPKTGIFAVSTKSHVHCGGYSSGGERIWGFGVIEERGAIAEHEAQE